MHFLPHFSVRRWMQNIIELNLSLFRFYDNYFLAMWSLVCLIQIMTRPNIKLLQFFMRDFFKAYVLHKAKAWGDIFDLFLTHCESSMWYINTIISNKGFFHIVLREKFYTAAFYIFFLKIMKSLQLYRQKQIYKPHNFFCQIWEFGIFPTIPHPQICFI